MQLFYAIFFFTSTLFGGDFLPKTPPQAVGFDPDRLARIDAFLDQQVKEKQIAGAVGLIVRKGKLVYLAAHGFADIEQNIPMRTDHLFRIASMTKPITSVAAMMLYEEGKFRLSDPLHRYLPEFSSMKVLEVDPETGTQTEVDARSPILVRHLLNHTAGFTYHWNPVLGPRYKKAGIGHGLDQLDEDLAPNMKRLAKLPLVQHPGQGFHYGLSVDVLGYLVEKVSGMPLDRFFQERIFRPLGMTDTHFYPPGKKHERLTEIYARGNNELTPLGTADYTLGSLTYSADYPVNGPTRFFSGGAGLTSTVTDFARFLEMLRRGGEWNGKRLLGRKTIELMTTDSLGDRDPAFGLGFGLGFSVTRSLAEAGEYASVGNYGWGGFWHTLFFVDPVEDMYAVMMSQVFPVPGTDTRSVFSNLVYQALVGD
ncbi:MAG: serine hydrolase domain-containing protein [Acidobacteriota bacterium]|nr:serine hydrolase domain-containing protein [Acidobacteriota bacterium]